MDEEDSHHGVIDVAAMDDDKHYKRLLDALFREIREQVGESLYTLWSLNSLRMMECQLWGNLMEEEGEEGLTKNDVEKRALNGKLLLIDKMEQASEEKRIDLLLKISCVQCRSEDQELLEILGVGQSEDFKTFLLGLSTERVMKLQDEIFRTLFIDFPFPVHIKFGALMARVSGIQGNHIVQLLRRAPTDKRSQLLLRTVVRLKRDKMTAKEVENVERWRRTTVLDGASKEVQSYFQSLETPVQENVLFEAILAVTDDTDKKKLRAMRGNHVSVEAWLLDDFMEQADEQFLSRVASMTVVGIMQMQSRETKPLETKSEDIELLLTLLVNAPDSTKERIRNLTPEQANITIQTLHDSVVSAASNETRRMIALTQLATQLAGVDMAKTALRMIAENEGMCSSIFSEKTCKTIFFSEPPVDKGLKEKYREAKKIVKEDEARNPTRQCAACGTSKPSKELKQCASCCSVWYCDKACQIKHWKGGHKKECKSLSNVRIQSSQPDVSHKEFPDIPRSCLAVPPSLTGFDKDVRVLLPKWDLEDHKQCREVQSSAKLYLPRAIRNMKEFFKVERLGGDTSLKMVGDMCLDALALYLLGYQNKDGNGVRLLSSEEALGGTTFSMSYQTYTPVPKGWQIPAEDRPYIPSDVLSVLERGIEWVRKNVGERKAL